MNKIGIIVAMEEELEAVLNIMNNIEQKECSEEYSRLLLVTDFICGMTDSYAAYLYEEINGVKA